MLWKFGLFFILTLGTSSAFCTSIDRFDLTFYIGSSEGDEIICGWRAPVKAYSVPSANIPYDIVCIWDDLSSLGLYNCRTTKYFYVAGKSTEATIEVYADDYLYVFLNNVQVTEISPKILCAKQVANLNSIKQGLNKLDIDAYNLYVTAFFGFKVTIKTKLN